MKDEDDGGQRTENGFLISDIRYRISERERVAEDEDGFRISDIGFAISDMSIRFRSQPEARSTKNEARKKEDRRWISDMGYRMLERKRVVTGRRQRTEALW